MKVLPFVPIELDKPRNLCLDLNAMVLFEEATGKSLFDKGTLNSMKAKDTRALLWACLKREDPNLTLEDVGKMIDSSNIAEVSQKLMEALAVAIPEKSDRPLVNQNGTG